jgi:hypothetical protein
MNIDALPFIHFMTRVGSGRDVQLVNPSEADDFTEAGGSFVAPVGPNGAFQPAYRFQFSIYFGGGEFLAVQGQKSLFNGVAFPIQTERRPVLLLTFELPGPDEPWFPFLWPYLPRVLRRQHEFVTPMLQRVPRRTALRYSGHYLHADFQSRFVELEPTDPNVFDQLLDEFQISVIGCDPFTRYERG